MCEDTHVRITRSKDGETGFMSGCHTEGGFRKGDPWDFGRRLHFRVGSRGRRKVTRQLGLTSLVDI